MTAGIGTHTPTGSRARRCCAAIRRRPLPPLAFRPRIRPAYGNVCATARRQRRCRRRTVSGGRSRGWHLAGRRAVRRPQSQAPCGVGRRVHRPRSRSRAADRGGPPLMTRAPAAACSRPAPGYRRSAHAQPYRSGPCLGSPRAAGVHSSGLPASVLPPRRARLLGSVTVRSPAAATAACITAASAPVRFLASSLRPGAHAAVSKAPVRRPRRCAPRAAANPDRPPGGVRHGSASVAGVTF